MVAWPRSDANLNDLKTNRDTLLPVLRIATLNTT